MPEQQLWKNRTKDEGICTNEAVVRKCSVKMVPLKIWKIHWKKPVPEFLF